MPTRIYTIELAGAVLGDRHGLALRHRHDQVPVGDEIGSDEGNRDGVAWDEVRQDWHPRVHPMLLLVVRLVASLAARPLMQGSRLDEKEFF